MKALKIIGLGIAIWGLSLVWPEVNLLLTSPVMIGLGLGLTVLIYNLVYQFGRRHHNSNGPNHSSRPSPPVALAHR